MVISRFLLDANTDPMVPIITFITTISRNLSTLIFEVTITIACTEDKLALLHGAELHTLGGELDHDEPPDSQRQCQPDGDSVDHDTEVGVEQKKYCPSM